MAKICKWPARNAELAAIAHFHAVCAHNLDVQLSQDSDTLPAAIIDIGRHTIMKHRKWSYLLASLSNLDS
jgi:hypothetical protein